jgi:hypothetical protein
MINTRSHALAHGAEIASSSAPLQDLKDIEFTEYYYKNQYIYIGGSRDEKSKLPNGRIILNQLDLTNEFNFLCN